jgi:hypothetical protein
MFMGEGRLTVQRGENGKYAMDLSDVKKMSEIHAAEILSSAGFAVNQKPY